MVTVFKHLYMSNNVLTCDFRKTLPNIDKYGGEPNEALKLPVGGNGKAYGIATVRAQCPQGETKN